MLSYEGARYFGFQAQQGLPTVQSALADAWRLLTKEDAHVIGCSRLDTGVDAHRFHAHVDSLNASSPQDLLHGLNGVLHTRGAADIGILAVEEAPAGFHARFSAKGKHYRYLLWHGSGRHPSLTRRSWRIRLKECPYPGMAEALKAVEGKHDFAAFRGQYCSAKSTVKEILRVDCWPHPRFPEMRIIDFWGDGFLKHMIRNIVGTAVDVAAGRLTEDAISQAFQHGQRTRLGQCAPGNGLSLMDVFYEPEALRIAAERRARDLPPF